MYIEIASEFGTKGKNLYVAQQWYRNMQQMASEETYR